MTHPPMPKGPSLADMVGGNGVPLLPALGITLFASWRVVAHRQALSRLLRDRNDAQARQCSHVGNPPSPGGVTVMVGLGTGVLLARYPGLALLLFAALCALTRVMITRLTQTWRKTLVNGRNRPAGEDRARGAAQADTEAWPFQADTFRIRSK